MRSLFPEAAAAADNEFAGHVSPGTCATKWRPGMRRFPASLRCFVRVIAFPANNVLAQGVVVCGRPGRRGANHLR